MALSSTVYRFKIQLSDVPRGIYKPIELRVAMHPSESSPYLLTRVIAYCLNCQEGLEFSQGIAATDEPALWVKDLTGRLTLWIEVGNPTARRLHKASKTAQKVRIYTYRDPAILLKDMQEEIYKKDEIEIFAIPPSFLKELGETLDRDNDWELLYNEGELSVQVGEKSAVGELTRHQARD